MTYDTSNGQVYAAWGAVDPLNWRPPTPELFPVLGYHVYRDGILIATLPPTALSFQDHNRKRSVIYLYAVAAFDINGEGTPTTIAIP